MYREAVNRSPADLALLAPGSTPAECGEFGPTHTHTSRRRIRQFYAPPTTLNQHDPRQRRQDVIMRLSQAKNYTRRSPFNIFIYVGRNQKISIGDTRH